MDPYIRSPTCLHDIAFNYLSTGTSFYFFLAPVFNLTPCHEDVKIDERNQVCSLAFMGNSKIGLDAGSISWSGWLQWRKEKFLL
jgi:hypothetical protein